MTETGGWQRKADFVLQAGQVHIWRAALLVDASALAGRRESLSPEENARADRFHFERHRRRFVVARDALRNLVSCYCGASPGEVQFAFGAHGKPSIRHPETSIRFNLSHSDDLMVAAFTSETEVGVDIEKIDPRFAATEISARFFTPQEHALIEEREEGRTEIFLRFWTAKEAVMKATGLGLNLEPNAIAMALDPLRITSIRPDVTPDWALHAFQPESGFAGTLAVRPSIGHCAYFEWPAAADDHRRLRSSPAVPKDSCRGGNPE